MVAILVDGAESCRPGGGTQYKTVTGMCQQSGYLFQKIFKGTGYHFCQSKRTGYLFSVFPQSNGVSFLSIQTNGVSFLVLLQRNGVSFWTFKGTGSRPIMAHPRLSVIRVPPPGSHPIQTQFIAHIAVTSDQLEAY